MKCSVVLAITVFDTHELSEEFLRENYSTSEGLGEENLAIIVVRDINNSGH